MDMARFRRTLEREFFAHPVITGNRYTEWFARGDANDAQVRELIGQFAVFSNQFIAIQAKRLVNADTEEGERCARAILLNECGVAMDASSGSIEGRSFSTSNAHLNWLREAGEALGMDPRRLGRWETASRSTKAFLEELEGVYGSRDASVGAGASFAVETWAAHGIGGKDEPRNFWRQLIDGLEGHNRRRLAAGRPPVPMGFFRYHMALERGHGAGVWRELEEARSRSGFSERLFLEGGRRALAALSTFWRGLDSGRHAAAWAEEDAFVLAGGF